MWWGGRAVRELSEPYGMVGMKENLFLFEGHQASKKETKLKMVKWQPHGGRITWSMIKYPHIKKNAQATKRALYPGLTTVSLDRIINL